MVYETRMLVRSDQGDAGRRQHYAAFYDPTYREPSVLVFGNCQAESIRIALGDLPWPTVRMPPVHELVADDIPHLTRLLKVAATLIAQPVHDDYHDLPLGTSQVAAHLPPGAALCLIPPVRYSGLHPFHVTVRGEGLEDPPIVPYHDLRVLARAAGLDAPRRDPGRLQEAVREIGAESRRELVRRQGLHGSLPIADAFDAPRFGLMRTLNHPGNAIWECLGARIRAELGVPGRHSLTRELLTSVVAPKDPDVIAAWGLDDEPEGAWILDGVPMPGEEIAEAHLRWYARHPHVVEAALTRHSATLARLQAA